MGEEEYRIQPPSP